MLNSVVIIQPPLVQLNGPYPSGAYLSAFFRSLSADGVSGPLSVRWVDASNRFFHALFSRSGLTRLFSLSRETALEKARLAEIAGDAETAWQLRRYVSLEKVWILWIDAIVSILCTGDRELCHSFMRSPGAPRGARMDAFLAELETEPSPDDARMLATLAVEDLADFIASVFDEEFSLVRYAESLASSERSFARVEEALVRPMVAHFLEPLCQSLWNELADTGRPNGKILFCISVPFPGCLVNALAMARSMRRFFGDRAIISMGGGYVNTELRSCDNERLFSYIDILSFDRGFGGYADLFRKFGLGTRRPDIGSEHACAPEAGTLSAMCPQIERERTLAEACAQTLSADGSGATADTLFAPNASIDIPRRLFCPDDLREYENRITSIIVPDYTDIDFSRYPRLADNPNPMHRLWSDGVWLKAYLAHGCYWHRCSFCDVSLDYIALYLPVGIQKLYRGLRAQAIAKGVHGIHLVDEAAPPRALRDFAIENISASDGSLDGLPINEGSHAGTIPVGLLPFWGNIRFEKTFTRDLADLLSAGGLIGVSGGIEIASPEGFKAVDKGIDLENLVSACAAFKEAGVLVHSYLIFGYWNEDAQEVIDTAEVMRQLFAAGLVDSAFWHKFTLTRHSRVYGEWLRGMHRGKTCEEIAAVSTVAGGESTGRAGHVPNFAVSSALEPLDEKGDFADNGLRFRGDKDSEKYATPLDTALRSWMEGEGLDKPVRKWFSFSMPAPRIASNLIETLIASYERVRDGERNKPCEPGAKYYWAGSEPVAVNGINELMWWYLGEETRLALDAPIVPLLREALRHEGKDAPLADTEKLAKLPRAVFKTLRHHGLCRISPLL